MSERTDLPPGWAHVTLGSLGTYINGRAFNSEDWSNEGLPIIRIQNLNSPQAMFNYYPHSKPIEDKYRVLDGELLISWSATLDAFIWNRGPAVLNQHIFRVEVNSRIVDKNFLYYLVRANLQVLQARVHGMGMQHITRQSFESIDVVLPPLNEQRRIVQKIEELFTELDAGVAALERVRANLKRYRAAVLKAAVEGALTADWRAQHPDVEPAGDLLQRILCERRDAWEQAELARYAKVGKTPPKGWQGKYKEPNAPDTTDLPELPEGWRWASVEQLLIESPCNGISIKGSSEPPGVPALRLSAMSNGGFDYTDRRYIPISETVAESLAINAGDYFVSRGNGSLRLVGRGTLAQEPPEQVVFPDTMIRLRFSASSPVRSYMSLLWSSQVIRTQVERQARTTAGIYKISQADIASFTVPVPPLAEQEQIVAEVEQRLSVADDAEARVAAGLKRAARLRQSILKRAFAGQLVPQDPTDEPAGALLERIRVERGRTVTAGKAARGAGREAAGDERERQLALNLYCKSEQYD